MFIRSIFMALACGFLLTILTTPAAAQWVGVSGPVPAQQYDADWQNYLNLGQAIARNDDRIIYPINITNDNPRFTRGGCVGVRPPSSSRAALAIRVPLASIDPRRGADQFAITKELVAIANQYCTSQFGETINPDNVDVVVFTGDVRSPAARPVGRPKGIHTRKIIAKFPNSWDRNLQLEQVYVSFAHDPSVLVELSRRHREDLHNAARNYWTAFHNNQVQGRIDICSTHFDQPPQTIAFDGQRIPFRQPAVICEIAKRLKVVNERLDDCGMRSQCALNAPANQNYVDQAYRPAMVLVTANLGKYLELLLEREPDKERVFQSFLSFLSQGSPYYIFANGGGVAPESSFFNGQSESAVHQRFRYYNSAAHLMLSQQYLDARVRHYIAAGVLPPSNRWKWPVSRRYLEAKAAYDSRMRLKSQARPVSVQSCDRGFAGRRSLECDAIEGLQGWTDDRVFADFVEGTHTFNAPREARVTYNATVPTAANGRMLYSSFSGLESVERLNYVHVVNGMVSAKQARLRREQDGIAPIAGALLAGMAAYVFLGAPEQGVMPKWTPDSKMHPFGYSANDLLVGNNPF